MTEEQKMETAKAVSEHPGIPTDAQLEHCANCRYSLLTDTGRYRCRVHGPRGVLIQDSWDPSRPDRPAKVQTVWATVLAWDWCPKWEAPRPDDRRSLGGPAVVEAPIPPIDTMGDPEFDKEVAERRAEFKEIISAPSPQISDEDPAAARKRAADEAAGATTAESEQPPLAEVPPGKPDPKVARGPVKAKK